MLLLVCSCSNPGTVASRPRVHGWKLILSWRLCIAYATTQPSPPEWVLRGRQAVRASILRAVHQARVLLPLPLGWQHHVAQALAASVNTWLRAGGLEGPPQVDIELFTLELAYDIPRLPPTLEELQHVNIRDLWAYSRWQRGDLDETPDADEGDSSSSEVVGPHQSTSQCTHVAQPLRDHGFSTDSPRCEEEQRRRAC